jgi:chromosome segregation ATPase
MAELDKTKELLRQVNAETGETLQRLAIELKEKERQIHTLTEAAAQAKSRNQMQKLSLNAHSDLFGGGNGDNGEGTSSFTDLIRSQSEETNKLRSILADREETIFHLTAEGEELRERVRRLEQNLQLSARTYTVNLANANQVREATELMLKKRIAALESLRAAH